jgi:hypothetical protein
MRKLILAGMIVMGGLYAFAGASQAATRTGGQGHYESQGRYEGHPEAQNARAACILPWYRFFGACDEAIEAPPDGNNWHEWQNSGHGHHYHYHR